MTDGCLPCSFTARLPDLPPRESVWVDDHWRVAHSLDTALPGWLVAVPRRHVEALDELDHEEVVALGPLLRDASAALRSVVGCVKTYVLLFAEKEGFGHVHFHVVPRMGDQPEELRGPRVMGYLGRPESEWVTEAERDDLALRLRAAWG